MNDVINSIKTPAYVCEEALLRKNLELLKRVKDESGAKILVALKGFALSGVMDIVSEYLDGATCSGLWEAKFAHEFVKGEIHTYSPAFKDEDFEEIMAISKHVVFNSFNQWAKFKDKALANGVVCGLRLNPESSASPTDMYNPCAKFSRLGITRANFKPEMLEGITGLHFHALCEESAQSLETVLMAFEEKFGEFIPKMKWINFGGGHHITRADYDVDLLISLIKNFREKYGVEVYLEPGEAVGWQTGFLISSVLDIVENEKNIAILDTSAEAHMPDTILMPYRPAVRGESKNGKFSYRFGGNTCLAGDIVGQDAGNADYKFENELKIGDKVIFEDQIHYTIVKNTTFNGIMLPDLLLLKQNGEIKTLRKFGFESYRDRN
ncbi:carboxynorspermidine decarboxylase [Campylobacter sp. RM9344]|uniref:Carboxynorspermidine/carboxyspermidine decarboxylase n=1 Tax=Campylobacter californiensis TaxID=1032243 RepID=A0AAW3ZXU7_9BACT|nr:MULTISPECIES: carboxynorspermidine decarboxylase [unclassified Campylobacter]MBE2984116.1 carboxynorspermidine decarboxylase [Campylobacter sp. RM6883]MBE2986259.1 carboxynorspermidine decarboxylase [Campylobacter sp. RM12919]MBE2988256.1 carboxynorspermidine decarboxylase [Campylobacter sp. RM12920]MBE2995778.1 carboxynorspermidine decarboxylase [Campylobacter sp. RM6913]MBE3030175.1 carboxynorspermidine decarboxylase [Campylobacter sp. RM9344]